jgi:hypothetical protein
LAGMSNVSAPPPSKLPRRALAEPGAEDSIRSSPAAHTPPALEFREEGDEILSVPRCYGYHDKIVTRRGRALPLLYKDGVVGPAGIGRERGSLAVPLRSRLCCPKIFTSTVRSPSTLFCWDSEYDRWPRSRLKQCQYGDLWSAEFFRGNLRPSSFGLLGRLRGPKPWKPKRTL